MATEQRLIDANALAEHIKDLPTWWADNGGFYGGAMKYPEGMFDPEDIISSIDNAPTVDAVPVDDMKEFAEDVVYQFGYYGQYNGRLHIGHGGLSTLEWAFDILGWDNPHPAPEFECEIDGCHEHATCGAPTSDGYKRMCGKHFAERRTNERKAD